MLVVLKVMINGHGRDGSTTTPIAITPNAAESAVTTTLMIYKQLALR